MSSKTVLLIDTQGNLSPRRQMFLRALKEYGYNVRSIMWDRSCELEEKGEVNGVTLKRLRIKAKYSDVTAIFKIFQVYLKMAKALLKEDHDIIHCGHLALLPLACIFGRLKGKKKVVYDVSEFYSLDFFRRLPKCLRPIEKAADFLENILVACSHGVICVPSRGNLYVDRYSRYNSNIDVISNLPDLETGNPDPIKVVELKKRYSGRLLVVYCGRIFREGGVFNLLEALNIVREEFPNVMALFLGNMIGDVEKEIRENLRRLKIQDLFEFPGYVNYDELQNYLSVAHAAIFALHPGKQEKLCTIGNSRKLGDYMRASLPIVAPDFDFGRVVVEEGCGFAVNTQDPEDIAKALLYIFRNPDKATMIGQRGRKAVEQRYNWGLEKQKLITIYQNL